MKNYLRNHCQIFARVKIASAFRIEKNLYIHIYTDTIIIITILLTLNYSCYLYYYSPFFFHF